MFMFCLVQQLFRLASASMLLCKAGGNPCKKNKRARKFLLYQVSRAIKVRSTKQGPPESGLAGHSFGLFGDNSIGPSLIGSSLLP